MTASSHRFHEKPKQSFEVSMGVYMVSREVINLIPEDRYYGFDNLMIDLIASRRSVAVRRLKAIARHWPAR